MNAKQWQMVEELRTENKQLRAELARINAIAEEGIAVLNAISEERHFFEAKLAQLEPAGVPG
jgi:hypothetical protein